MTRLYAEDDVRAMLEEAWVRGRMPGGSAEAAATHLLSTATHVAAPDLSRLAEAVRGACLSAMADSDDMVDAHDHVARLDLAPIIAASGTGQGEAVCGDCGEPADLGCCALASCPLRPQNRTPRKEPVTLPVTDAGNALVDGLLAEAHAKAGRMGLPVVRTCGECGWCAGSFSTPGAAHCRKGAGVAIDRAAEPPPQCPLRTPRKEQKR